MISFLIYIASLSALGEDLTFRFKTSTSSFCQDDNTERICEENKFVSDIFTSELNVVLRTGAEDINYPIMGQVDFEEVQYFVLIDPSGVEVYGLLTDSDFRLFHSLGSLPFLFFS